MDVRCPACGEANPERAKFCLNCGTALAAGPEIGSRESRRVVTVVFADMVGFTSLGERLDQESLRRVMDRFYGEMRGAIEGQGGTLAKFIGDAVLAVWGTPQVREDDALRAVRAAEAMRHALAVLNSDLEVRWGVHVGMRTGVNTGEVVVDPSRPADLLVGDTLNVAARLEQAADDGEVLVGADTFQLVRDEAILEPVEPLALKGKSRPLPVWRLVDGARGDRRAAPRLQAPLVGREAELERLRGSFADVVDRRAARMVTVIGSPGLGKTRLVSEFVESLADDATVLLGRCEASGEGITFQPVAEVLRMAAGIGEEDSPDAARDKLAGVLPDDEPQRERIVDRTAALLGLAPVASNEETFWAVRRLLEALARRRPVVLVHDDIHWGQPTFLDLLEHLVSWVRDAPLLIVALARPELREVRPALAEPGDTVSEVLALDPLVPEASRVLAGRLLGDAELPEALAERILETTEGNPLFLGEMLRMLADEGVLRRAGDRWIAADDSAGIAVPPTIQALLAARIERLADDERSVVERAAVIGHQFYRGAVAELAPPPVRPRVDMALDTLRRKDLVRPEDFLWLDEKVFRFHHVLIRDAAYRSLLKEARAELHERFADWLEAKAGDMAGEHEEILAFHLEQAYGYRLELGTLDERGRAVAERAAARLHSAGRRALLREDLPAAINLLRRALPPVPADDPRRAEVLVDLAEALLSAGDTAAAQPVIDEIGLGADRHEDERLGAWATVFLGQLDNLTGTGELRETIDAVNEAAEVLARVGDHAGEAKAHQTVAGAHAALGQVAAAEAALDRALVAARAADDRRRVTAVLSGAPRAALWGPAPIVRASGRCLDVVRILRMTPGNRHVEAAALRCQAVLEAMRGRADAARGILDTCRMTFEELGLTFELQETDSHAGIVELLAGDPAAAEERLRAAQEGFEALGAHVFAAQAAAMLARALLEQDRQDEALEATRFAEEHGGEDLKTTIAWLGVRAEALARRGEEHEGLILARRGVELAEPTDALADKADSLMALAAVEVATGGADAAREAARRARELYAAKDHAVGVARADAVAGSPSAPAPPTEAEDSAEWEPRTPAEHVHVRWNEAFNTRDWDALAALYPPDHRTVSRRSLADDDIEGRDAALALMRSVAEAGQGITVSFRPVGASDEVIAGVQIWRGITESGSPGELEQGLVSVNLDGRVVYAETFDGDDDLGLMRRFEELRTEHAATQVERAAGRVTLAFASGNAQAMVDSCTEDFVLVDHRDVGWGQQDRRENVDTMLSWKELAPDAVWSYTRVIAADEDVLVGISTGLGSAPDGGAGRGAIVLGQVVRARDGRVASVDMYEPDDEAAMLARFEELRGDELGAHDKLILDAHARRDWSRLEEAYTEDYTCHDHRGLGWDIESREDVLAQHRAVPEIDANYAVDAHVLRRAPGVEAVRYSFHGPAKEWEVAFVSVRRIEAGAIAADNFFDGADEEAIRACFEELQRVPRPAPLRFYDAFCRAFDERDWDAMRALFPHEVIQIDRRAMAWEETRGGAAIVEVLQSFAESSSDARMSVDRVLKVSEDAVAMVLGGAGTDERGGPFEYVVGQVELFVDGTSAYVELFEPEDDERMLARYHELTAPGVRPVHPVTRAFSQHIAHAFNERDWEAYRGMFTDDFLGRDLRLVAETENRGPDETVEVFRGVVEVMPEVQLAIDTLAGEVLPDDLRLTAALWTFKAGDLSEIRVGSVAVSRHGKAWRSDVFEDDVDAVLTRYDAVKAELLTVPEKPLVRRVGDRWVEAFRARDFEAVAALYATDAVFFDHRPVSGPGVSGEQALTEQAAALVRLAADAVHGGDPMEAVGEHHGLGRNRFAGTDEHGGEWAIELLTILEVDALGRITRVELFGDDQETEARARLDELAADPPPPLVVRAARRFVDAFNSRDWDSVAAMYTDDHELIDHRRLRSMNDGRGPDATMEILQGITEVSTDVVWHEDLLMVLGDRHRLVRWGTSGTDERGAPWETVGIAVSVVDESGRFRRFEAYDLDDEAAARTRFLELAGPHTLALGPLVEPGVVTEGAARWTAAHNAHDLDAIAEILAEDYRYEDRRPLVAHSGDRAATIETWRMAHSEIPDLGHEVLALAVSGRVSLARERWTDSRGSYEVLIETVAQWDDSGRLRAAWVHEPGDPAAWAKYIELSSGPVAEELQRRYVAAFNGRDWEAIEAMLADDLVQVDRRVMGTEMHSGRAAAMTTLHSSVDVAPDLVLESRTLAASDEAIAAILTFRGTTPDGGPAELEMGYLGIRRGGVVFQNEYFEPDDEEALRETYEEWSAHLHQARQFADVVSARDWERLREFYDDGFSQTDYREVGAPPVIGGPEFADHLAETFAPVADVKATVEVFAVDGNRRVGRITCRGHNEEIGGVEFEVVLWTVTTIDGLRILQSDIYRSEEDARAALAGDDPQELNLGVRHFARRTEAFNTRNWDLMAELYNDDAAYEDRRAAMRHEHHGGSEAMVEMWQGIARNEAAMMRTEIVATDGPRRAIARYLVTASYRGGPYEVVIVEGVETDESGRGWRGLIADDAPDDEIRELLRSWHPEAQPA